MGKFHPTAKADGAGELTIYDEIGGWGLTAKDFKTDLRSLGKVQEITLRINSPGGSVFDGMAIYNLLRSHGADVAVAVDGIAASIASVILCAGDVVEIAAGGMLMVHNPAALIFGDAAELRKYADALDKMAANIVDVYAAKTGAKPDDLRGMMAGETWMDATEAVAAGFADAVAEDRRAVACAAAEKLAARAPERFRALLTPPPGPPTDGYKARLAKWA